jgi:hypothetical protein
VIHAGAVRAAAVLAQEAPQIDLDRSDAVITRATLLATDGDRAKISVPHLVPFSWIL